MTPSVRRRIDTAARTSLFLYANTSVVLPVCLLAVTSELGFSFTQAGALSLIGSFVQFGILLGAIPIAAAMGKIRPLRWGIWIIAGGLLLFTRITGYVQALAAIAVIALGQALIEALQTPLIEDIHPEDDGSRQVLLHSFWPMGIIVGTVLTGEALSRGVPWRIVFIALAALCLLGGTLYPNRAKAALPRSRADLSHMGEIFSRPLFWVFCFALAFAGAAEGGFTFWTASYIQIEFGTLPRSGGLGTAFFSLGMAAGRLTTSRIAARFGLRRILVIAVAMALLFGISVFFIRSLPMLYGVMVIMGLFIAPFWPALQTYTVRRLGADPTMVMVFMSCFGVIGFAGASFLMGIIGDTFGLRTSFLVAPCALSVLLALIALERRIDPPKRPLGID